MEDLNLDDLCNLEPGDMSTEESSFQSFMRSNYEVDGGNREPNSNSISQGKDGRHIDMKALDKLGRQDLISLVFLMEETNSKALGFCERIENYKGERPLGFEVVLNLWSIRTTKSEPMEWREKLFCALYMIRKFKTIKSMAGLERSEITEKFENQEHYFLDSCVRIKLFHLAYNLKRADSLSLLESLLDDIDDSNAELQINFNYRIETNLLKILHFYEGQDLNVHELLFKIIKNLPEEKLKLVDRFDLRPVPGIAELDTTLRNGLCIILNQVNFKKDASNPLALKYDNREGADLDEENLIETWERFGCEVKTYRDLTGREICSVFRDLAKKEIDYAKYGFLVICIMGHGDRTGGVDHIIGADGVAVELKQNIYDKFLQNNSQFSEKLTFFIVQACRGQQSSVSFIKDRNIKSEGNLNVTRYSSSSSARLEVNNFILFNSTIPDHPSYRDPRKGTFFIRMICRELRMCHPYDHLTSLLNNVIKNLQRSFPLMKPVLESSFGKKVYLYAQSKSGSK